MTSHASSQRLEPVRSATWPSISIATTTSTPTSTQAFKDDLEQHPERHFLSPMAMEEVYGWDSDSDSEYDGDDDKGEWQAGITDFSLFAADRKRAKETGEPLDGKWGAFVEGQEEMFRRSVEHVSEGEGEMPALTPDVSPRLGDDLDAEDVNAEDEGRPMMPQIPIPDYLTVEVKPSDDKPSCPRTIIGPDDELPLSFWPTRAKAPRARIQRPGLRHARTLSGRRHVWRRPGEDIFTVGEDVYGEAEAEREDDTVARGSTELRAR